MDVRDYYPDLKVFSLTTDDYAVIKLRFDPPNRKDRTPIVNFSVSRIDADQYQLDDTVVIQEIENAFQNRDGSTGINILPAGD